MLVVSKLLSLRLLKSLFGLVAFVRKKPLSAAAIVFRAKIGGFSIGFITDGSKKHFARKSLSASDNDFRAKFGDFSMEA
ncbi:hypothetical protein PI125_g24340 [Phytophthora idaei]|nr:hypothetical protein PI125_g24340 [Phytophthora idaei]